MPTKNSESESKVLVSALPNSAFIDASSADRRMWILHTELGPGSKYFVFDSKTQKLSMLNVPKSCDRVLRFSDDGMRIVIAEDSGEVVGMAVANMAKEWSFEPPSGKSRVSSASIDGNALLIRTQVATGAKLDLWRRSSGGIKKFSILEDSRIQLGEIDGKGKYVIVGLDNRLVIFSAIDGRRISVIRNLSSNKNRIRYEWVKDKTLVVYDDSGAKLYNFDTNEPKIVRRHKDAIAVDVEHDQWIQFNISSWSLEVMNRKSKAPIHKWPIPKGAFGEAFFASDGSVLTSHEDGTIRRWKM